MRNFQDVSRRLAGRQVTSRARRQILPVARRLAERFGILKSELDDRETWQNVSQNILCDDQQIFFLFSFERNFFNFLC